MNTHKREIHQRECVQSDTASNPVKNLSLSSYIVMPKDHTSPVIDGIFVLRTSGAAQR